MFIIAGIIVSAVGDELLLAHPEQHPGIADLVASVGWTALFLFGYTLFKGIPHGYTPVSHLVGLALLAAIAIAATLDTDLSLLAINALTNATLCLVAGWEAWSLRFRQGPKHA